ncbi:MAG TPA: ferrous iron transport protein B [Candidatus Limnocylindrales bacterium]|nr:ferrous iron transport protein B [Candidatus Limnocylindrales bacterium]
MADTVASCHEAPGQQAHHGARRVALVGSPNSGKSTLFNALTGAGRAVGNYPGTSVEVGTGRWADPAFGELSLTDLPGAYSLDPMSPDEALTADLLHGGDKVDAVVVVCDGAHLGRSLVLAAHVRQLPVPVVVALTMTDVAARRGLEVDDAVLAERLGVRVVRLDPRRRDVHALAAAVAEALASPVTHPLTLAPTTVGGCSVGCPADCTACPPTAMSDLTARLDPEDDLARAEAVFTWVTDTTAMATSRAHELRQTWSDRIDRWVTAPVIGPVIFLGVMWAVFALTTTVAAPLQGALDAFFTGPVTSATTAAFGAVGLGGSLVEGFVVDGLIAGVGMLLTFVPLMAIMFVLLALLEDSGYMARAAVVTDRLMSRLGLPGRAFLPLVVGFGCNVPAISAVRVLPDARHRLLTALLVPFTSCSARLTVYVMVAATFFPANAGTVVFLMYVTSILLVILGGLLLRSTLIRTMGSDPLVLDLPPYQAPSVRLLGSATWMRLRGFLETASGIIVATVAVVWALGVIPAPGTSGTLGDVPIGDSLYAWIADQASVLFIPTGFAEWHAIGALIVGFVAKEAVISSWAQTYPSDVDLSAGVYADFAASSGGHPQAAAAAFLVFLLAYTPCVATLAAQKRQIGTRWTGVGVVMQLAMAWLLAVAVFQIGVALT